MMSHGATTDRSRSAAPAPAAAKEQRVTKQRLAVSAVLDELTDFVSTQELHRILQDRGTSVSLATSYRILQSLADDGLVDVLRNADGEAVYRRCAVTGHHHHLLVVIVKPYATRLVVSRSILLLSSLWVLLRTAIRRRTSVLLFQSNFSRAVQLEVARRTNMMVQLGLATAAAVNEVGTILQALVRCAHRFS